jgi:hypothetical protein
MIAIGTRQHGAMRRRAIDVRGNTFYKSEWMEAGDDPILSPTAFLVEQPPNTELVPHFHRQNQFQVFVDGGGMLGKHPVQTVTVHYAGAYTGYGPLVSGEQGIKYFTIRPVCEAGMVALDTGRDQMIRGPKRHESLGPIPVLGDSHRQDPARLHGETFLLPLAQDGLGVGELCLASGQRIALQRHAASQGVFIVVLGGTLRLGERELGEWDSVFISKDEAIPELIAGSTGLQCLSLHCPPREPVYFPAAA